MLFLLTISSITPLYAGAARRIHLPLVFFFHRRTLLLFFFSAVSLFNARRTFFVAPGAR